MQPQIFTHKNLGQIRVIGDNENPLFCLRDICEILELTTPVRVLEAIKIEFEGGEFNSYPLQTNGGMQKATFVTEPQLYFVLMRSDKPKAKPFRQWVVNEVLPSIRKNGFYATANKSEDSKEYTLHTLIAELQEQSLLKDSIKQENESLKDELLKAQREIIGYLKQNAKPQKPYKLDNNSIEQIRELKGKGKGVREITKLLNVSESSVRKYVKELR